MLGFKNRACRNESLRMALGPILKIFYHGIICVQLDVFIYLSADYLTKLLTLYSVEW